MYLAWLHGKIFTFENHVFIFDTNIQTGQGKLRIQSLKLLWMDRASPYVLSVKYL